MHRSIRWPAALVLLATLAACRGVDSAGSAPPADTTLRIAFGSFQSGAQNIGLGAIVRNLVDERLANLARDGRVTPNIVDAWTPSSDRRTWVFHIRPGVTFHDGTPLTSLMTRDILRAQMPNILGTASRNVVSIEATADDTISVTLREPSTFLLESLELPVERGTPAEPIGTAAFHLSAHTPTEVRLTKNAHYHSGTPAIDQIELKQYDSLRSAWADLLRGQVDMLYDVAVDAQEFLQPSSHTRVYNYLRPYSNAVLFNMGHPTLKDVNVRRALNSAIDRAALVSGVLKGHGEPSTGTVWPYHWAYDRNAPSFTYAPQALEKPFEFTCLFVDASQELLALAVQQQLKEIGITMHLESVTVAAFGERLASGKWDAFMADTAIGPTLLRAYQFWHTGSPTNYGRYSSAAVDAAFDAIERAADDTAYRAGVASLQRAIVEDPPAIFLTWSERARAVSTRFDVPVEPGRDILGTLRLWRPIAPPPAVSTN